MQRQRCIQQACRTPRQSALRRQFRCMSVAGLVETRRWFGAGPSLMHVDLVDPKSSAPSKPSHRARARRDPNPACASPKAIATVDRGYISMPTRAVERSNLSVCASIVVDVGVDEQLIRQSRELACVFDDAHRSRASRRHGVTSRDDLAPSRTCFETSRGSVGHRMRAIEPSRNVSSQARIGSLSRKRCGSLGAADRPRRCRKAVWPRSGAGT